MDFKQTVKRELDSTYTDMLSGTTPSPFEGETPSIPSAKGYAKQREVYRARLKKESAAFDEAMSTIKSRRSARLQAEEEKRLAAQRLRFGLIKTGKILLTLLPILLAVLVGYAIFNTENLIRLYYTNFSHGWMVFFYVIFCIITAVLTGVCFLNAANEEFRGGDIRGRVASNAACTVVALFLAGICCLGIFTFWRDNFAQKEDGVYYFNGHVINCDPDVTEVNVREGTSVIEAGAFRGCKSLTTLVIPDSVEKIESGALYDCTALETLTIPFVGETRLDSLNGDTDNTCHFSVLFGTISFTDYSYSSTHSVSFTGGKKIKSKRLGAYFFDYNSEEYNSQYTCEVKSSRYYHTYNRFVPKSLHTVTVTGGIIPQQAFYNCDSLETITLGTDVTIIGDIAFAHCDSLQNFTIEHGVTSIGKQAFYDCSALREIVIPGSVQRIEFETFYNCDALTDVTLKSGVVGIGQNAFYGCDNLKNVTLEEGVTSVETHAFYHCITLNKVVIPASLKSIGKLAFYDCPNIQEVHIPDLKAWCTIDVPVQSSPTCYGTTSLYLNGKKLSGSLVIPEGVKKIAVDAFSGCGGIVSVTLPRSLTAIGTGAFWYCKNLLEVRNNSTLPIEKNTTDNYGRIGYYAQEIIVDPEVQSRIEKDEDGFYFYRTDDILYLIGCEENPSTLVLPAGHKGESYVIRENAFAGRSELTALTVPEGVIGIDASAFANCAALQTVVIADSVTSIGEGAFRGCSSLQSITLPFVGSKPYAAADNTNGALPFGHIFGTSSYTGGQQVSQYFTNASGGSIGKTYYIPASLRSVTVTGGSLTYGAFYGCSMLTSVTLKDDVTRVESEAFSGCSGLTEVVIPEGTTKIGYQTFLNCTALERVTIPSTVSSIHKTAFSGTTALCEIHISDLAAWCGISFSDNPLSMKKRIYLNGEQLVDLVVPEGVTSIAPYAFFNVDGLRTVTLPESLQTVGASAFESTMLLDVTIPAGSIDTNAFRYCFRLSCITLGSDVTQIKSDAFHDCFQLIEVRNLSTLALTPGESTHGGVASYASVLLTEQEAPSKIFTTADGFRFYENGETRYLLAYLGNDTVLRLPTDCNGEAYEIYTCAFNYVDTITEVIFSNGVSAIGKGAFERCNGLTALTIPGTVTRLDHSAFYGCASLTTVVLEEGVKTIDEYSFKNCPSLKTVTLPQSLTYIGAHTFYGDKALVSIRIPTQVTHIGAYAFYDCSSLTIAIFEAPSGWYVNGSRVTATTNSGTSATYLRQKYATYAWTKE